ncbi:hypothetical protein MJO28_016050 [Puccinia striiformis f. sp. tritici]|uniref:Uncharacterized protein n=1 Tax=Puccinia striiformis f. sp. tritici TaxID=168172 RepID=A0ACC0DQH4_9BASI|nr:hypothetical protein MJO28_016050 [Puccinia striiformis f. sp. tritici]
MNLLSLFLLSLVSQVIMGIDLTSEKSNKFKSRSVHSSKKELEWNMGGGVCRTHAVEQPWIIALLFSLVVIIIIRPYNKDSQTTRATKMMKISLFTLLLIIAQGVVSGTPIPPNPNLKTLVSRSPHSDGDVGGDPGDQGGNSAGNPLCPDCG